MTKKILIAGDIVLKRALDIVAVVFLVMNFFIWYINDAKIDAMKYDIYHKLIFYLFIVLLLNAYRLNPRDFVKDNVFFLLIFALGLYNSLDIIMNFNGIVVDMGERSRELILQAFPSFLVILAAFRLVDRRAFIVGLVIVLLMILGFSILAILREHRGVKTFLSYSIDIYFGRQQSVLNNPNALGEYAFIGVFIAFFLSLISKWFWVKILCLLPIPVLFYSLILSGSRTGLFMILIMYLTLNLYFSFYKKKSKIILALCNIISIVIITFSLNGYFSTFIDKIRSNMNLNGRFAIWTNIVTMINDNPFKGIGYNNFTYVYNELFKSITSPHNMLFGVVSEFGFFALILVIGWFAYLIIKNQNTIIRFKEHKYSSYFIVFNAFYITFFIGQMTEYSFLKFSSINTLFLALQALNFKLLLDNNDTSKRLFVIWIFYLLSYEIFLLININKLNNIYIESIVFIILQTIQCYIIFGKRKNNFLYYIE